MGIRLQKAFSQARFCLEKYTEIIGNTILEHFQEISKDRSLSFLWQAGQYTKPGQAKNKQDPRASNRSALSAE